MIKKIFVEGARHLFLILFIPFCLITLLEIIIRLSGVETEVVKSKEFNIQVPIWTFNDLNYSAAEDIYGRIIKNTVPAESAEWMKCFEEAKYLQYKMKPNVRAFVFNTVNQMEILKGKKVLFKSNSDGFRTKEISRKKEKGVFRIICLGDSATFGWGVNQEETFSKFLEDKLNSNSAQRRFEVLNLAIPGYTSYHGKAVFEHFALKYSPDMLILSFGGNDGRPIPKKAKKILERGRKFQGINYFLLNLKTYRFMRRLLYARHNPFKKIQEKKGANLDMEAFVTPKEYQENLGSIIKTARERGIETLLLALCCPLDYLNAMTRISRRMNVDRINGMKVLLESIPSIIEGKLYPNLAKHYRELYGIENIEKRKMLYVTSDTCHPNVLGHKILADTLYDYMIKK